MGQDSKVFKKEKKVYLPACLVSSTEGFGFFPRMTEQTSHNYKADYARKRHSLMTSIPHDITLLKYKGTTEFPASTSFLI